MVFEFFFYAAAILTSLTVYGLMRRESVPTVQAIAPLTTPQEMTETVSWVDGWDSWESQLAAMDALTAEELLEEGSVEVEPEPEQRPVILDRVVPFQRPVKCPNYADMKAPELRKLCQKAGVKWRNAHGKNKHLSTQEMIAALTA